MQDEVVGGLAGAVKAAFNPATWGASAVMGGIGGVAGYQRAGIGLPSICTGFAQSISSAECQSALADQRRYWAIAYAVSALLVAFVVGFVVSFFQRL